MTLAVLQGFVPNRGDAWTYSLAEARRFLDGSPEEDSLHNGSYLKSARLLGRRVAELHLALSRITNDPAFRPEPFTLQSLRRLRGSMRDRARTALGLLREGNLPTELRADAEGLLAREGEVRSRFEELPGAGKGLLRIRVHGDLHLGQILYTGDDFYIIDFEGEPARPLAERRAKESPLRDAAGMLRSFEYAAQAALRDRTAPARERAALESRARAWGAAAGKEFLDEYRSVLAGTPLFPQRAARLLDAFLLDKALYELAYELNNRPTWVSAPLRGVLDILAGGCASCPPRSPARSGKPKLTHAGVRPLQRSTAARSKPRATGTR
ncbi:MAG: hypothetical protein A2X36_11655 [Elusimicrobia bacterium GWA2_69_24]|nr:MAG: hypothetical protein A2X36_11655 [Elusimicrobia bacterium GWA2_69_24]